MDMKIEYDVEFPGTLGRFHPSQWGKALDAISKLQFLPSKFGELRSSSWTRISGMNSRLQLESLRASVCSMARKQHSTEKGWKFQTSIDYKESEGYYALYVRKIEVTPDVSRIS